MNALDNLVADLESCSANLSDEVYKVALKVARQMDATVQRLVPVDTGMLRESLASYVESPETDCVDIILGTAVEYAAAVEFGAEKGHKRRSNPTEPLAYLRPTLSAVEPVARKYLAQAGLNVLKEGAQ